MLTIYYDLIKYLGLTQKEKPHSHSESMALIFS